MNISIIINQEIAYLRANHGKGNKNWRTISRSSRTLLEMPKEEQVFVWNYASNLHLRHKGSCMLPQCQELNRKVERASASINGATRHSAWSNQGRLDGLRQALGRISPWRLCTWHHKATSEREILRPAILDHHSWSSKGVCIYLSDPAKESKIQCWVHISHDMDLQSRLQSSQTALQDFWRWTKEN